MGALRPTRGTPCPSAPEEAKARGCSAGVGQSRTCLPVKPCQMTLVFLSTHTFAVVDNDRHALASGATREPNMVWETQ